VDLLQCLQASSRTRHSVRRKYPRKAKGKRKASNPCSTTLALVIVGCGGRNSYVPTPEITSSRLISISPHILSDTDTPRVKVTLVQVLRSAVLRPTPTASESRTSGLNCKENTQNTHTHQPLSLMLISEDCMRPLRMCRHLSCRCCPLGSVPPRLHHTLLLLTSDPARMRLHASSNHDRDGKSRADPSHC
jgi:hypothetical protein